MDPSESASSEDAPELDAGLVVAKATDDKGPSSVRTALVERATDNGSSAAASVVLTASAGWCKSCIKRRVASALMDLEEHTEALLVISGEGIPPIVPLHWQLEEVGVKNTPEVIVALKAPANQCGLPAIW
ncbi:hypothetical protein E4T56_gene1407 [Termitomyces sp. T112]|nr:hypothetical protein E4T56_gene1407 [Termitomyces sp. T112]